MITYFVGVNKKFFEELSRINVKNILVSFAYRGFLTKSFLEELKNHKVNIFLDSGGYSIFSRHLKISVNDYIKFLLKNKDYFKVYANLDNPEDPEWTFLNQEIMEKTGLNPLPVYHPVEFFDSKYRRILDDYCDKYSYIAIGGVANARLGTLRTKIYLDYVFSKTIKKRIKVHGFGINSFNLLKRYPFYSIDSTAWLQGGKFRIKIIFKNGDINLHSKYRKKSYNTIEGYECWSKHYLELNKENIRNLLKIEEYITKLWEIRGINYENSIKQLNSFNR